MIRRIFHGGVPAAAVILVGSAVCLDASAALNDPPYFNLWDGAPGSGQTVLGDGGSIQLCGTSTDPTGKCDQSGRAIFSAMDPNSGAGSGNIQPFLRFEHNEKASDGVYQVYPDGVSTAASAGVEGAYNTNFGNHTSDLEGRTPSPDRDFINQAKDHPGTQFNHAIRLSDMFVDSAGFLEFFLDINEPNGDIKEVLRMDELELYVANTDSLNDYDPLTDEGGTLGTFGSNAVKVWDMDWDKTWTQQATGQDTLTSACVGLNGSTEGCGGVNLNNEVGTGGSGDLDYRLQVQASLFLDALNTLNVTSDSAYVYLYNYAGAADNQADPAQAGYEEWIFTANDAVEPPVPPQAVPVPATSFLFGVGLLGMLRRRRRMPAPVR